MSPRSSHKNLGLPGAKVALNFELQGLCLEHPYAAFRTEFLKSFQLNIILIIITDPLPFSSKTVKDSFAGSTTVPGL